MTNAYSFEGIIVFSLLVICTCAYMRRVPRLKQWFLSEKKGFFGVFYKASVIGTRLHVPVALTCILMAFYLLFLRWWRLAKFCVFFMIYHQKINSLCRKRRDWKTIFHLICVLMYINRVWRRDYCKYVLLICNLWCHYICMWLAAICFSGKDIQMKNMVQS